jgi:hypothetical protein
MQAIVMLGLRNRDQEHLGSSRVEVLDETHTPPSPVLRGHLLDRVAVGSRASQCASPTAVLWHRGQRGRAAQEKCCAAQGPLSESLGREAMTLTAGVIGDPSDDFRQPLTSPDVRPVLTSSWYTPPSATECPQELCRVSIL